MNRFYFMLIPLAAAVVFILGQYAAAQSTVCSVQGPDEKITVKTDKKTYVVGEPVVLTGKVEPGVAGESVRLDVYDGKNQSYISDANLTLKEDGTFSSESHVPGTGTPGLVANVLPINAYARNFGEYIAQHTTDRV